MKWLIALVFMLSVAGYEIAVAEKEEGTTKEDKQRPNGPWIDAEEPNSDSHKYSNKPKDEPEAVSKMPFNGRNLNVKFEPCQWGFCDKNGLDKALLNDKECDIITNRYTVQCEAKEFAEEAAKEGTK